MVTTVSPHFHFITLFPSTIEVWLTSSILGRARQRNLFDFSLYQLRDFTIDRYRSVDDAAYGGGGGMVLKIEPLVSAIETIQRTIEKGRSKVIYFSPAGKRLSQGLVDGFAYDETSDFILICGHYEGVDQRLLDHWVDCQISLGDFVLTGGELPAVAFADAVIRRIEGVLNHDNATSNESFSLRHPTTGSALLEYPHYTRPADFRGYKVPSVLLDGDHEKVAKWRLQQALSRTEETRPDLLTEK